jgi:hypothetical protein
MCRNFIAGLAVATLLLANGSARAEGWNLNPFASTPKKTTPYKVSDGKSGSWLPSWGSSKPRKGPTTWDKVKAAPGTMYNQTKKTLSPLNPFPTHPKKTSMHGKPKKDEVAGFWPNWMTVEEKQETQTMSASEFIAQRKPGDE